eukprot:TRINITY_DN36343_c0_g1_i2.p2 TRINITY_DN36343_c0_g1~~TRINITY_DN36343_c0_g1_i2.p2  ORF type:complete len:120 (+),score=4.71 TRINITY_DN36343_c0_g1_i2:113-472(+)
MRGLRVRFPPLAFRIKLSLQLDSQRDGSTHQVSMHSVSTRLVAVHLQSAHLLSGSTLTVERQNGFSVARFDWVLNTRISAFEPPRTWADSHVQFSAAVSNEPDFRDRVGLIGSCKTPQR